MADKERDKKTQNREGEGAYIKNERDRGTDRKEKSKGGANMKKKEKK